jgi:integrase
MALCLEAFAYSFAEDFVEILVPFSVDGVEGLVVRLLDGGGLRRMEALRLRIKDLDGEKRLVTVLSGKGDKERNTLFPHSLLKPLQHQLRQVRQIHRAIWGQPGAGCNCPRPWRGQTRMPAGNGGWQRVFPPHHRGRDAQSRQEGHRHLDPTLVQKAVCRAVLAAGITKAAGYHSFRHSKWLRHAGLRPGKATHLLERGQTISTIEKLLGHSDVGRTMIDTHVLNRGPYGISSPAASL